MLVPLIVRSSSAYLDNLRLDSRFWREMGPFSVPIVREFKFEWLPLLAAHLAGADIFFRIHLALVAFWLAVPSMSKSTGPKPSKVAHHLSTLQHPHTQPNRSNSIFEGSPEGMQPLLYSLIFGHNPQASDQNNIYSCIY